MSNETCRVGKGAGTAFPCWYGLSCAVPTNDIDASGTFHGGHGALQASFVEKQCQRLCPPYGVRG
jgi:hypothetical protein